ncbi:MAG: hypothetical protein NXH84_09790 [Rhodobacteraceae bacterium]|jgi:predicted lipid-binding transport protein (Tim44 family)|nr:hypothetical protein [Paracoccaceae bacterium]
MALAGLMFGSVIGLFAAAMGGVFFGAAWHIVLLTYCVSGTLSALLLILYAGLAQTTSRSNTSEQPETA